MANAEDLPRKDPAKDSVKDHIRGFCDFADEGASPFHGVENVAKRLREHDFKPLNERDADWNLLNGGKYYFTRNQSSIVAFAIGRNFQPGNGFTILGAHSDSPCLILKPNSNVRKGGYALCGVQTYGGGLWYTWFDRDLSVCGRVAVKEDNKFVFKLVKIDKPILRVPSLAIHLQERGIANNFKFNKEDHLIPMFCQQAEEELNGVKDFGGNHPPKLISLLAEELNCKPEDIVDFELCLFDMQKASVGGAYGEFINTARIDNLLSCYMLTEALIDSLPTLGDASDVRMIAFFDNEEVGSTSAAGAKSDYMRTTLERITKDTDHLNAAIAKSILVSCDCAHAVHPNYISKHEKNHAPVMNQGLAIKMNANQRYASNMRSSIQLRQIAKDFGIKLQTFSVRNDCPCGSTIGPHLSAELGIRTVDVGLGQLSMHSIREQCGSRDIEPTIRLFTEYYNNFVKYDTCIICEPQLPQ